MTTRVHRRGACGGAHQLYWVEVGGLKGVTGSGTIRPNPRHRGGIRSPGKIWRVSCSSMSRDVEVDPSRASLEGGESVGKTPTDGS